MGNKIYMVLLVALMGSILAWASYRLLNTDDDRETYEVSVILDDAGSDRYIACRQGMEQAASDYGITLTVLSSENAGKLARKEIEKGADGLIIEPDGGKDLENYLQPNTDKLNVVLFNSDIEPEEIYPSVTPNNDEVGQTLYQALLDHYGDGSGSLCGCRVAVVSEISKDPAVRKRYESFMELLNESDALWIDDISGQVAISGKLIPSLESGAYDVIISFDSKTAEECIDAINAADVAGQVGIICEGYSEQVIYYLDKGVVTEVVLPNEFAMGYAAVKMLYKKLNLGNVSGKAPEITLYRITKDNLYDSEIEKIVFPLAQ